MFGVSRTPFVPLRLDEREGAEAQEVLASLRHGWKPCPDTKPASALRAGYEAYFGELCSPAQAKACVHIVLV